MSTSYGVFAHYYDTLTENVGYEKRAEQLCLCIQRHQEIRTKILLDLACGTGSLSEQLARKGFDVIGVDRSEEMLNIALEKKVQSGLPIQYLRQDMRRLNLFGTVGVTVCALDSLNHLHSEQELKQVFSKVSLFTEPKGLFLFDLNTEYKHRQILADQCFVYELPEAMCIWQNTLRDTPPDYPVTIQLDFFEACGENRYSRSSEQFTERIFSQDTVESLLAETDFSLLEILDGDRFLAPLPDSQRLLYIARKRGENPALTNHQA